MMTKSKGKSKAIFFLRSEAPYSRAVGHLMQLKSKSRPAGIRGDVAGI
ncbi:MAG: hypothetical protein Q8M95_04850 [Candidatus Methanoperedens sp.]|nr:hypothetical protein [Candidatus Methanoperedenaceae archaeon]MDP3103919.1 hypothetical protein [Candidatus Methanoperedens sp.]